MATSRTLNIIPNSALTSSHYREWVTEHNYGSNGLVTGRMECGGGINHHKIKITFNSGSFSGDCTKLALRLTINYNSSEGLTPGTTIAMLSTDTGLGTDIYDSSNGGFNTASGKVAYGYAYMDSNGVTSTPDPLINKSGTNIYYVFSIPSNTLKPKTNYSIYICRSIGGAGGYKGSGVYSPGVNNTPITLTYTPATYTVNYHSNGGSGSMSTQTVNYGDAFLTIVNTFSRTGYTFVGWREAANSGTWWNIPKYREGVYDSAYSGSQGVGETGNSWTWNYTANLNLYAQWIPNSYTITANPQGGKIDGSTSNKLISVTYNSTTNNKISTAVKSNETTSIRVTFDANEGSCSDSYKDTTKTTRYTFQGWYTGTTTGSTKIYDANGNCNPGTKYWNSSSQWCNAGNLTVNAVYTSSSSTSSITLPTPTRSGYKFMGWSTSKSSSSGVTGTYTPTENVTLYAIWEVQGLVDIYDGSEWKKYTIWIYNGSTWNQYAPYVCDGTTWKLYS